MTSPNADSVAILEERYRSAYLAWQDAKAVHDKALAEYHATFNALMAEELRLAQNGRSEP